MTNKGLTSFLDCLTLDILKPEEIKVAFEKQPVFQLTNDSPDLVIVNTSEVAFDNFLNQVKVRILKVEEHKKSFFTTILNAIKNMFSRKMELA